MSTETRFHIILEFILASLLFAVKTQLICEEGYTCYEDSVRNVVWLKQTGANIYGPNCQEMCEDALLNNAGVYHSCDRNQPIIYDAGSFADIAAGLNFSCSLGGGCWSQKSWGGNIFVTAGSHFEKRCYFPDPSSWADPFTCKNVPGNGNCFGERFSTICPCVPKALDEACDWSGTTNQPQIANWGNYQTGTSCIDRVNYWRKRACDENWVECPPSGLPPMTECVCCNQCGNSQSAYDKVHGSHASFKRCGDMTQGSGGGATCANVIDAFVSERTPDGDGIMRCQGHCGPIVSQGCQTFFWGNYEGHHTLNWRTCNVNACSNYCWNPTSTECFESEISIAPDTSQCPTQSPTTDPTSDPTNEPTSPSENPSKSPTSLPTKDPTKSPTNDPTTKMPTQSPVIFETNYTIISDTESFDGSGSARAGVAVGLTVTFVFLIGCLLDLDDAEMNETCK